MRFVKRIVKYLAPMLVLFLLGLVSALAAEITIVDFTPSSTFGTYNEDNLINGAGLVGELHSGDWNTKWLSNSTTTGSLLFDFGSTISFDAVEIWNYGPGCCGNDRSTKDMDIFTSLDGIDYSPFSSLTLSQPMNDPFAGERFEFADTDARYIRFDLQSNYGDPLYIGLSEVKFFGDSSPIPEPTSLLLFSTGLGILGLAAYRRKRK